MRANLRTLASATLLAARGAAQEVPHFELDVIFPRNETYLPSEIFPVAIAIQNLTAVRTLGEYHVLWDVMPYSHGVTPGGITYDFGELELLEDGGDGTSVFVANSNVTGWIGEKWRDGERYALNWVVDWPEVHEDCGTDDTGVSGHIMFGATTERDVRQGSPDANGTEPDIMKVPECPALGTVVEIRPKAEDPDCPVVMDGNTGRQGEPCNVKVGKDLASRIEEKAESMLASAAASTAAPTFTDGPNYYDEEDAAPGILPPLRATVAVAGLAGFLVLAL